jgi:hypothetical protein
LTAIYDGEIVSETFSDKKPKAAAAAIKREEVRIKKEEGGDRRSD